MNTNPEYSEEKVLISNNVEVNHVMQLETQKPPDTIKQQEPQKQSNILEQLLELVKFNDYNYFEYPPTIEKAELHRQAYYLCPDKSVINKYAKDECECCKKKIYRKNFNWFCGDLYDLTVDEFGTAIPLYFSLIKFQVAIFIIVFGLYGIFFMRWTQLLCENAENCNDNTQNCIECQFSQSYYFTDIDAIQQSLLESNNYHQYQYFQAAAFIVFFINLHLPFLYDLLLSYIEMKYQHRDPFHSQNETSHSTYIRHIQHKHEPEEIFNLIKASVEKNPNPEISGQSKKLIQPMFDEIVYIHDTSEIIKLQLERQAMLSNIVSNAYRMTKNENDKLVSKESYFVEQVKKLEELNAKIQKIVGYLKINTLQIQKPSEDKLDLEPIPFSKKAIIRFRDQDVNKLIIQHFKRTFMQNLRIKLNFIIHPKIIDKIDVKKSYRINGLFWEHIGLQSQDRVTIKLKSIFTMVLACITLMVAYELIYLYANDPDFKKDQSNGKLSKSEKAATNIFTILVPIITTGAILVIIINQKKAMKNTFSHQERGFMHFLIVVNYILVTFVPYIITFEFWNGKGLAISIYNLVTLTQNKLITKNIFHTFHIRFVTNLLRKRKALKNYTSYFQGELNNLLTPAAFPQRSRNCNAMYSLTIGLCLIFVCPLITLICFIFNCYIYCYDRYSITHFYTIDKRFTIALLRHQIKVYSIAFYPIKIYLYMKIFWNYGWLIYAGVPVCIGISILTILFRRPIINFILDHLLGVVKRENTTYRPVTYTESYQNFLRDLRIDEQNDLSQKVMNTIPRVDS